MPKYEGKTFALKFLAIAQKTVKNIGVAYTFLPHPV